MATVKCNNQRFKYFLVLDFEATCDNFCKIPTQVCRFHEMWI